MSGALRWEVHGDVFGQTRLLAVFLSSLDAGDWVQAQADAGGYGECFIVERVA